MDSAGNLYVANFYAGAVNKVTPEGVISTFATGFDAPSALAFDSAGNLYVSNTVKNTVSRVTPGGSVSTFASGFDDPWGLAFDSAGNLYVANAFGNTVSRVTPTGKVSTFATGFDGPFAMAIDSAGNLYVANYDNNTVSEVTPAGVVSNVGSGFDVPDGLAVDSAGNLYVANYGNGGVSGGVTKFSGSATVPFTLAGSAGSFGSGLAIGVTASPLTFGIGQATQNITGTLLSYPGPSQSLTFTLDPPSGPASLGSPSVNTLTINERAAVQFSTGSETVNESAGTFSIPVTVSGTATDTVTVPFALGGTAASGVAYSDLTATPLTFAVGQTTQNITGTLLSDPGPTQTLTLTLGFPTGDAALFSRSVVNTLTISEPAGVQFGTGSETVNERAGTFSIPVTHFGTVAQTISTFASGFKNSVGLAFDSAGNLYVGDTGNNTVAKVTPAGVVSTFATGFDGPFALAFDAAGNLYVANSGNNTVSEVTPAGVMSTFASGFNDPSGLAFDSAGNLYVASSGNNTVIELSPADPDISLTARPEVPNRIVFGATPQSRRFNALKPKHGRGETQRGPPCQGDPQPCFGSRTSARVAPQQSPILSPANIDYRPGNTGVKRGPASVGRWWRGTV